MEIAKRRRARKAGAGQQEVGLYEALVEAGQPLPPDELFKKARLKTDVVNALKLQPFLPGNQHTCPQFCTLAICRTGNPLHKPITALDSCKFTSHIKRNYTAPPLDLNQ
jgi:hypothetical protein